MQKIFVPPIKCQGIKTRLVNWILSQVNLKNDGCWVEPFAGSGVVGFNLRPARAIFADINPHIIHFYKALQTGEVTSANARRHLEREGVTLAEQGEAHFYFIRERFNAHGNPLDFLFLSRSCFNGVMRFNQRGNFNVPFGRKPKRFSKAYVTKICNQIEYVVRCVKMYDWKFICADFRDVIANASGEDFIYCDPPYFGRHSDYFNAWSEADEADLQQRLQASRSQFIVSTWHSNRYRSNSSILTIWNKSSILLKEHFYYVGGDENNRNSVLEALILSGDPNMFESKAGEKLQQAIEEKE